MSNQTIPVLIDDIKRLKDFQRTRCTYFRIEFSERPFTGTFPVSSAGKFRVAAWGNWAVLTGPAAETGKKDLFLSPDSIRSTLMKIEEDEELFLDLGYIWIPNQVIGIKGKSKAVTDIRTGDVYRLSTPFFQKCYSFAAETITGKEWRKYCLSSPKEIHPSPDETKAFREWRKMQIQSSYDRYHHRSYEKHRIPRWREK